MIYLVDASVYVFRAWFAIPDTMTDRAGRPVNAFYGYARFLGDLVEKVHPQFLVVAFDESLTTSFRNEIYPQYKANRARPPEELKWQFAQCRRLTEAFGISGYGSDTFEADDIIATLASAAHRAERPVSIVTRDKDLAQLIREGDELWDFAADKRLGYSGVQQRFGVAAEALADLQALTGDSVDNIPGVPGVGPKTASVLLDHFGSLDAIYQRLDEVVELPLRGAAGLGAKLAEHEPLARLSRELTGLHRRVPVPCDLEAMRRRPPDLDSVHALYDELGVGRGLRDQADRIGNAAG